jgi:hypothetical protein
MVWIIASDCADRCRSLVLLLYDAFLALAKALRDRRTPRDQRGFVREPLRKVGVILLYDVEYRFLGKLSMILGKEFVQVSELFIVHGHRASAAIIKNIPQPVDPVQTFDALGYPPGGNSEVIGRGRMVIAAPARACSGGLQLRPLTIC